MRRRLAVAVLLCSLVLQVVGAPVQAQETKEQKDARMKWFRDARFGMFIHWGVYSVPAGEWKDKKNYGEWFLEETKIPVSEYKKFAQEFNPVKFDAKEWVRIAKDAGMKYMVITSKHHDGFGMFKSQLTDWCIKSTPFQRDPLKELADACKEAGIVFCFYHSIMDWHHPDWGTRRKWNDVATGEPDMDKYTEYMKGQLKELLTGYGPIGILWFDGEWEKPWTNERGLDVYNYVRGLQPNIIVNNRVGKGRAGMSGMDKGQGVGDYGTPEQEIPPTGFGEGVDWESCMTMNGHWGYNKNDQNWKTAENLVRNLIDCASKGGNYLLNVGPTAEGLIPAPSVERLAEMGKWMKVNGEAIYGTAASPFKRLSWGRCTQRAALDGAAGKLYLHVFDWPADGKLVVPGLKNKVMNAYLLSDAGRARLEVTEDGVSKVVAVGAKAPDAVASVVVLEIEGKADVVVPPPKYGWKKEDGQLALVNGADVVWQFNFKKEDGKPFFHPLNLADGWTITELRPADHPWHRGLWWSWKYINHVNYWEENKKTGLCDGRTELLNAKVETGPDFSAKAELELNYHVPEKAPVLTEKRVLVMQPPDARGNYRIDWTSTFTAGSEDAVFDRTPPKNFSGGYAGLSCRMRKECKKWTYTACDGTTGATNIYGKAEKWVDFSGTGGIAILDHPSNLRHPTPWYPNGMPFFSPAVVFHEPYTLPAGKSMTLRYRVFIHSEAADKDAVEAEWKKFAGE